MDAQYLEQLSPAVQALVSQVETGAGIDIKVQLDPSRAGRGPDGAGILACDIDEFGATILVPSGDYFPEAGVVHELLHVRRLLVEGVPRLAANIGYRQLTSELTTFLTDFDNMLEHLVIVPEELGRSTARHRHWESITERTFRHDIPAMTIAIGARRAALMQWAFVDIVLPQSPARAVAEAYLADKGLASDAAAFVSSVQPLLGSKPDLVRHAFDQLQLPDEMAVLRYYDSHVQDSRDEPL